MHPEFLGVTVMAMLLAAPFLIDRYLRQLPEAPTCPSCRGVARQAGIPGSMIFSLPVPAFARTFVGECGRCGWRGRMRWRWARSRATSD